MGMLKSADQVSENWQVIGTNVKNPFKKSNHQNNTQKKKPKGIPKTSAAYWRERVKKASSKGVECPHYSVRIHYKGKRVSYRLETADKEIAAVKARNIYVELTQQGEQAVIEKHRPDRAAKFYPKEKPSTIGDLVEVSIETSTVSRPSLDSYIKAIRRIASEIYGLNIKGRNYGHIRQKWIDSVDSILIEQLTRSKIQEWSKEYVNKHESNKDRQRATVTVNSLIRNAQSLFSKRQMPVLRERLNLPEILPFKEVARTPVAFAPYQSKINAKKLVMAAEEELREEHPASYLIFQLALRCGLRMGEIDHLLWENINFQNNWISVEVTKYHKPKTKGSIGLVNFDDTMSQILSQFHANRTGEFVVESSSPPTHNLPYPIRRCKKAHERLLIWLREQGVTADKPVHELRKEAGSLVYAQHDLLQASKFLRHSNIVITSTHYVDPRNNVALSI